MTMKTYEPHKSSIGGMDANIMALLTYVIAIILNFISGVQVFAWIVPLIIYFVEKDSMLVKFHAAQAFVLGVFGAIIYLIIWIVTAIFFSSAAGLYSFLAGGAGGYYALLAISVVISIIIAIFEIISMINAYKYKEYSIPFFGGLAEKFKEKFGSKTIG